MPLGEGPTASSSPKPLCLDGSFSVAHLLVTLCLLQRQETNSQGLARQGALCCSAAVANVAACLAHGFPRADPVRDVTA